MINGGVHTDTHLDIQEYQIVGIMKSGARATVAELKDLYTKLGGLLSKKYGPENISFGDEQGYTLDFKNNFEPLEILKELLYESTHKEEFCLGLDVAASSFYDGDLYKFDDEELQREQLLNKYKEYFKNCE